MFETFQIPAFYVANPALLSLYSSGRVSGFVIETGAGVTQTLAIYEGYCLKAATHRTGLAGREMTHYLMRLLNKKGYSFSTTGKICHVVSPCQILFGRAAQASKPIPILADFSQDIDPFS